MLTDKEATCLEIMKTDDLMAIGNWEPIIVSLVAKGYAEHVTGVWHRITSGGRLAFHAFERRREPTIDGEAIEIRGELPCP